MEINFDGIVGPTHNYSGLSFGNLASENHKYLLSNPREAALQGLEKMYFLKQLGIKQGVLPPQDRPHLPSLRALGFSGSDKEVLEKTAKESFSLLKMVGSASSCWAANAATITPSTDTLDHKVHFTPANLVSQYHRSIEQDMTAQILKKIFHHEHFFVHHAPLISSLFSDEGAANHTRLCRSHATQGLHLFTFGKYSLRSTELKPQVFPARQAYEASSAITRLHQMDPNTIIFLQQNPYAIDKGGFHNDVVAVGNERLFLYHEDAYLNTDSKIHEIIKKAAAINLGVIDFHKVKAEDISLQEAIDTYLFNSQVISLPNGEMALIAPIECKQHSIVFNYIQENLRLKIPHIYFIDVQQSMQNGGGPACLRLRIPLNNQELCAIDSNVLLEEKLYQALKQWIKTHYRDRLHPNDLKDPLLLNETREALDKLTSLLQLGSLYEFQKI